MNVGGAGPYNDSRAGGESSASRSVTPALPATLGDRYRYPSGKVVRVRACVLCGQRRPNAGHGRCVTCYARAWERSQPVPTDYDEAAVLRAMTGERLPLSRADRLEAVRRLHARHLSARVVGYLLGVHPRQVQRDLSGLGLTCRRVVGAA